MRVRNSLRLTRLGFAILSFAFTAYGADVLFYGWGKGKNLQQTGTSTTVADAVDPWEVTSFVFLNPTGAVTVAYFGTVANPTFYLMNNDGDRFQVGETGASQAAIDSLVPNGTYRITMQTVHEGTKVVDLALSGNNYPNTPMATNYTAMQSVNPAADFTVYWNAFTGGTTNDVIVASVVSNQFAPYGSITNSPLPGTSGTLNGTNRAWTIPSAMLTPNTTRYVRVVFYKAVSTNKTTYAGVTGYAVYGTGTTIPLVTTSAPTPPPAPTAIAATNVASTSFNANWNSSSGATGYRLDVSTNNAFSSYVSGYQNLDVGNVNSKAVTGLSAGLAHYYRVRAYNTSGPSGNSGTITVTTTPNAPAAPTAIAATNVTSTSFNANWNSSSGATGYRLDVSTNVSFANFVGAHQNLDVGNVTSRSVTGLVASTTHYYRLRAYNASGTSGNSGTITATTAAPFRPMLTHTRTGTNLVLFWATNDPAFKLEYATNLSAAVWISNPVSPSIVSAQYAVTNRMTNNARLFRLKK